MTEGGPQGEVEGHEKGGFYRKIPWEKEHKEKRTGKEKTRMLWLPGVKIQETGEKEKTGGGEGCPLIETFPGLQGGGKIGFRGIRTE